MKATNSIDEGGREFAQQLKENFSEGEVASFVLTILGMSELAHRFIWEKVKDFMELPIEVKYSLAQHANFYQVLAAVARNEWKKGEGRVSFLPVNEDSWASDSDFEQRFILVVKGLYEELRKEGKV